MVKKTYAFVLDCSMTMAWCFEDESTDYTDSVLECLTEKTAIVPALWNLEVANVLLLTEKKNRITKSHSAEFIDILSTLPIIVDPSTSSRAMQSIYALAFQANLTIYDAAYLELAIREKIPLVTLDKELISAAKKLQIPLKIS